MMTPARMLMIGSAVLLLCIGVVLNFAPNEFATRAGFGDAPLAPLLVQMLAAALMALGVINWMSKGHLIGGIYGRAVGMGNLLHFGVGAFALARTANGGVMPETLWGLFAAYLLFAVGFGWIMFAATPVPQTQGQC